MSDSSNGQKIEFAAYGIYGVDVGEVKASSDEKPVKPEKVRMLEFFRGVSKEDSEIILLGFCPRCYDKNLRVEWTHVRIGYKECSRCDWKDY